MSIMADCTCDKKFGYVFGDYSKSCPRHGSTAKWLEEKREQREAGLRDLRQQALTRPVHGGYPDGVPLLDRKTFCPNPPMTRTQEQGEKERI